MQIADVYAGEQAPCCAVFEVIVNDQASKATDARYVYASKSYHRAISRELGGLVGRSFLEIGSHNEDEWLDQCYRVVTRGETISGFRYDPLVRDWISFSLAPTGDKNRCVYNLIRINIDAQQRNELMATVDARTSRFISEMLSELAAEQSYRAAMNGMLAMMSQIIHADRISVFECIGSQIKTTFELLAEGGTSQLGVSFNVPKEMLSHWFKNVTQKHVVLVPNISVIERFSEPLYRWCCASGVSSLLAAPFFSDGEIVGFLGAYNYEFDKTIDLDRLFEAVSTFIAARIENRQLIESLKHAGSYDTLTGILNRRGAQAAMHERIKANPNGSHVLAILDLDDFKRINDVYGHSAGDEALCVMARTLGEVFSSDAIVSRNGGDEFLILLSNDAAASVSSLLAQLVSRGLEFDFEGVHHHVTISAGYARYPQQASELHELASKADSALYAVKLSGKASFGKYTTDAEKYERMRLGFSARDILEYAPYLLLVSRDDERREILFVSNALASLLGYGSMYDLTRSVGGSYAGVVHPDDREKVTKAIEHASANTHEQRAGTFEFRALAKDGSAKKVRANFRFVNIAGSGRVLYSYLIAVE